MQNVKVYDDVYSASADMKKWIRDGWRVHTCTMAGSKVVYTMETRVLVVYERETKRKT